MGTFPQKQGAEEKPTWFLKEQKTGYLPMHLSQFRSFLRKLTFFEGGLKRTTNIYTTENGTFQNIRERYGEP